MITDQSNQRIVIQDLGDGLILRRGTPADAEALGDFNSRIHTDEGPDQPNLFIKEWTHDLASGNHPTFSPEDFTIVEKAETGEIVSTMNLISQIWNYEGIPFKVGRPELVGTLAEFRKRGLVRKQFEVIHQWSAERDEMMQAITGIPYYYRLFGYEMALNLGGGRLGYKALIPKLPEGAEEPYRIRPATEDDIPFMEEVYQYGKQREPVACQWNTDLFRYEISGKSEKNVNRIELHIIEANTESGEKVGFLGNPIMIWGPTMALTLCELKPGISWKAVSASLLRYLKATGEEKAKAEEGGEEFSLYGFWLGEDHPLYHVEEDRLPRRRPPYAWYIRIPDLPGFIRHIAGALEMRLAKSDLVGHSGETKISFYRGGLRLVFEKGKLITAEEYHPEPFGHSGDAAFPGLTFLQLLMGYRSLDELKYSFADVFCNQDHEALLRALFPRCPSDIWMIS